MSRPKKTILLYCPNEVTRGVLTFQMETWGYRVICAELDELQPALAMREFDLVLLLPGFWRGSWKLFDRVARRLETRQTDLGGAIRIYDTMQVLPERVAPAIHRIPNAVAPVEHLRSTLKIVLARKHGPRKHTIATSLLSRPAQTAMVA